MHEINLTLSQFTKNKIKKLLEITGQCLLNGQSSTWIPGHADVLQGSILGPLFLLIYIINLSKGISSTAKLFADDISIFSNVNDIAVLEKVLSRDLQVASMQAY